MTIRYTYNGQDYLTEQEAQEAVVAVKTRLDNNPSDWCIVKAVSQIDDETWDVPTEPLTDSEINNPNSDYIYSAYSPITGENYTTLNATELTNVIRDFRTAYCRHRWLDKIFKNNIDEMEEAAIVIATNEDMSGYV